MQAMFTRAAHDNYLEPADAGPLRCRTCHDEIDPDDVECWDGSEGIHKDQDGDDCGPVLAYEPDPEDEAYERARARGWED